MPFLTIALLATLFLIKHVSSFLMFYHISETNIALGCSLTV